MTKLAITADPSFLISVTVYEDSSHEKAIGSASSATNADQPWTICCCNWKNSNIRKDLRKNSGVLKMQALRNPCSFFNRRFYCKRVVFFRHLTQSRTQKQN